MGRTAAERQRERRLRLKNDSKEYERYLKRDRERKQIKRANLSSSQLKELREKTRKAVQKHREESSTSNRLQEPLATYRYGSKAALGKAKSRVFKALPKSPRKRSSVLQAVSCSILGAYIASTPVRKLNQETSDMVVKFYHDDSISRVMPGKSDCIVVKKSSGEKEIKQKRHLVMTVAEAHRCFTEDHPEHTIGKSKFAELRPKWVFLSSEMPHNVCGCKYHENIILLLEALHRTYPDAVPLYSKQDFTSKCVCCVDSPQCMSDNCGVCGNARLFFQVFRDAVPEKDSLTWYQWNEVNGYLQKAPKKGSSKDAFDELAGQLPKFFWHSFIKEKQASSYNDSKAKATLPDSVGSSVEN